MPKPVGEMLEWIMSTVLESSVSTSTEPPTLEVRPRPKRRQWSAAEKRRIVALADQCQRGELGALMRREGIYSTQLATWRRVVDTRAAMSQSTKVSGKKARENRQVEKGQSLEAEVMHLRQENERLAANLRQMELVLSIQKKVAAMCTHVHSNGAKR
jgi:transposase